MKSMALVLSATAACLALGACGDRETTVVDGNVATGNAVPGAAAPAGGSATAVFPRDARIVEENGVTYRIGPDDTRVALGPNDARIVVENGVRYRVDPGGARVRLDERGLAVDLPDVDVGVNEKGNLDVDVK